MQSQLQLWAAPVRRCAVTGILFPRSFLVRFHIQLDPTTGTLWAAPLLEFQDKRQTGNFIGRSVYVLANRYILQAAVRRGAIQRGFRRNVQIDADVADRVADWIHAPSMASEYLILRKIWPQMPSVDGASTKWKDDT